MDGQFLFVYPVPRINMFACTDHTDESSNEWMDEVGKRNKGGWVG